MALVKILKTAWCKREFLSFYGSNKDIPKSQYIEQDSFLVPSDDGDYTDYDCVIVVNNSTLQGTAKRFADHVIRVGDNIKVAVVYI